MENLSEKLSSFKNNNFGIFFYILLLFHLFCFIGSSLHAQDDLTPIAKTKRSLVYQFPKDGDINLQPGTTLILRYSDPLNGVHLTDLSFFVKGEQSGEHSGNIKVCDDDVTIIFVPDNPFVLGEKVIALFQDESLGSTSFNFHITSMTSEQQVYWLRYFREKEETENREFRIKTSQRESADTPQDTSYFPKITIDANSAGSAPGNIFITPSGISDLGKSIAFISMLDNSGISLYKRGIIGHGIVAADFKVQKNNMLTFPNATMDGFYEMDSHFRIVDSFKCGNGLSADIHDFELLPNGDAILVAYNPVNTGSSIVADNIIQVIDKDKNVIFNGMHWGLLP